MGTRVNSASITVDSATSPATFTIPGGTGIQAGDLIIVATDSQGVATPTVTVKDSVNNVNFTQIRQDLANATNKYLTSFAYVTPQAIADGSTITVTSAGATQCGGSADIFRGYSATIDQAATGQTNAANNNQAAPALGANAAAGTLVLTFDCSPFGTITAGTPFTAGSTSASCNTGIGYVLSASGASTYASTWSSSGTSGTQTVSFQPAVVAQTGSYIRPFPPGRNSPAAWQRLVPLRVPQAPAPETSPGLELSGFGSFTGVASNSTINSVTVTVTEHQSSGAQPACTIELWDYSGAPARIGTPKTGTASTSGSNVSTATFAGVTFAMLATLRVRVYGNAAPGSGYTESVDAAGLTVNYSPPLAITPTAITATATATAWQPTVAFSVANAQAGLATARAAARTVWPATSATPGLARPGLARPGFSVAAQAAGNATASAAGTGAVTAMAAQAAPGAAAGAGSAAALAATQAPGAAAGAGATTALVTEQPVATAAGTGSVSDVVTQAVTGSAAGTGAISAKAVQGATAPAAGAGAVTAVVTQIAGAAAAGAGSVTAAGSASGAATATGAGAGAVTAVVTQIAPATSAGAGSVTDAATQAAGAAAAGAGSVTAVATQIAPAGPAGAAAVTDVVTQAVTASAAGAGSVTAAGTSSGAATANAAGAAAVTAVVTQIAPATSAGAGSVTDAVTQIAKATAAGAGSVTAAGQITGTANVAGAGAATAKAAQAVPAQAAGAAALSALAAQQALAAITGAGSVTAAATVTAPVTYGTARQGVMTAARAQSGQMPIPHAEGGQP